MLCLGLLNYKLEKGLTMNVKSLENPKVDAIIAKYEKPTLREQLENITRQKIRAQLKEAGVDIRNLELSSPSADKFEG